MALGGGGGGAGSSGTCRGTGAKVGGSAGSTKICWGTAGSSYVEGACTDATMLGGTSGGVSTVVGGVVVAGLDVALEVDVGVGDGSALSVPAVHAVSRLIDATASRNAARGRHWDPLGRFGMSPQSVV